MPPMRSRWSIGSTDSVLSLWSRGSVLSHQSDGAVLSAQSSRAVSAHRTAGPLPSWTVTAAVVAAAAVGVVVLDRCRRTA